MNNNTTTKSKISVKKYQCKVCKNIEEHATNHFGDIYCNCKNCKNNGLSCIEPEAIIEATKLNAVIKTKLTQYRFNISNPDEKREYDKLKNELKEKGLKLFDVWDTHNCNYWDNLPSEIEIDTSFVFDNQWNSSAGRVFDWYEGIYPNKKIKQGYWLELTDEHAQAREPKDYSCKITYKGELMGIDTISAINPSEASNQLFHKYFKEGMDIWQYKEEISLIKY